MSQHTRPRPICAHCDGFPQVAITTGQSTSNGQRRTVTATCLPCNGTGHTNLIRAYARSGK
ncbi:hypothetical protein F0344_17075 [Streptomyces finlayi]|uniref:Uncharacterized protein n=1 Tax=Streptomyces finlayi TaxID=67296 RepID=A0A7G7BL91_9ACTN|nr:hypothetical protein [Streptomyces finlayi]QNE76106.1 hypothetical protein F0344_17075 [Streptomyces finlayi]